MKEKRFFHDISDAPITAKTGASRDVMPLLGNPAQIFAGEELKPAVLRLACSRSLPFSRCH
jgi:hypothetical protein